MDQRRMWWHTTEARKSLAAPLNLKLLQMEDTAWAPTVSWSRN